MKDTASKRSLYIAKTGAANLASVVAMCNRAGIEAVITDDPDTLYSADYALLPGVGAFGSAMSALRHSGLDTALRARINENKSTMGICLGMQMLCEASEETPGVQGIGAVPVTVEKFSSELKPALPLPQLGWNKVEPTCEYSLLEPGWAYFANSYRVRKSPQGYSESLAYYGEPFVAALEKFPNSAEFQKEKDRAAYLLPSLLLCQFHPELSGAWGMRLFKRWMGVAQKDEIL